MRSNGSTRGVVAADETRALVPTGVAGGVNSGVASNAARGSDLAVVGVGDWSFETAHPPERLPQCIHRRKIAPGSHHTP
jgi:hypothetical protein